MSDQFWEDAARRDPLWAILSDPSKKGRRWQLAEFLATGRREISLLFHQLSELGFSPSNGSALDFGCGIGRLAQALAPSFEHVVGLDVSPTMIDLATRLNPFPGRVQYLLNEGSILKAVAAESMDFVYSDVVLQHIPPENARQYISEFLRVLLPGGVAVFQLTAERRSSAEVAPLVPMCDAAYRARIEIVEGWRDELPGSGRMDLLLSVTNESPVAWDLPGAVIRAGNHWLDSAGVMLVQDDGRVSLAASLAPRHKCSAILTVQAPSGTGRYVCEIDAVHEGVTWFGDRGSKTLRLPMWGISSHTADNGQVDQADPEIFPDIYVGLGDETTVGDFPMYGIAKSVVLAVIESEGGRCFYSEPDERGGPEWTGHRYFLEKPRR